MCGIVGYTGKKQAAQFLLDGLATLGCPGSRQKATGAITMRNMIEKYNNL